MAKGKKTGGRNFARGTSGNLSGRPRLPDDLRAIKNKSSAEIEKLLFTTTFATEFELKARLKDDTCSIVEKILAKGLLEAAQTGDFKRLQCLLDRLVGKVSQPVEVAPTSNLNNQLVDFIARNNEPWKKQSQA